MYQVRVGGGTALVSQYSEMGLFRMTSFTSPADTIPESGLPFLWKLGGTARQKKIIIIKNKSYYSVSNTMRFLKIVS